jgi:hypothetical protein
VLEEQLREEWHARERAVPIQPAMTFAPEGLGAGTVLLHMDGPRRLQSVRGQEVRLLALLCAFHGRPTALSSLRNIERAAGTRPVRWYFSQKQVADYVRDMFRTAEEGRENIKIIFEPWPGRAK